MRRSPRTVRPTPAGACRWPRCWGDWDSLRERRCEARRWPAGLLVKARDGYTVLFSLGELDAKLGAAPAIVATTCDGKTIDASDGPFRLIVPQDQRPARSVRQVERLAVVDLAG